jgi:hypothetical protein
MLTEKQATRQAIIKEFYVGLIGWLWISGFFVTLYLTVSAIFFSGSWARALSCAFITWVLYRVTEYYYLEGQNAMRR